MTTLHTPPEYNQWCHYKLLVDFGNDNGILF